MVADTRPLGAPALDRRLFCVTFLLVLAVIAGRNWPAIVRAEFWAEDGADFFSCGFEWGARCLLRPVTGYHLFLSRSIAWAATGLPVVAVPYVYAISAWAINAFVCAYVVHPGYAWLVPKSFERMIIALLLAVAPGSGETYLNLANLQQSLTLFAFLILLRRPARLSRVDLGLLTIIFFSTGTAILVAPLLLSLYSRTRLRPFALALGILAISLGMNVYASQLSAEAPRYTDWARVGLAPRAFVEQFFTRLLFLPWLGVSATNSLIQSANGVFYVFGMMGAGLALLVVLKAHLSHDAARDLALALLGGLAYYPMIVVLRNYALIAVLRPTSLIQWEGRYSFLVGCLALLFWGVMLTSLARSQSRRQWTGVALLALLSLSPLLNCLTMPPRPDLQWPLVAARIQKALNKRDRGKLRDPVVVEGIRLQPNNYLGIAVTIRPISARD